MNEINVQTLHEQNRYVLDDQGKHIGAAHYLDHDGQTGVERIFFHTIVDQEYSGQGLASKLAQFALDDTVASGLKIVPVCPYIKSFLKKHPDFTADVVEPTQAHLDLLPRS